MGKEKFFLILILVLGLVLRLMKLDQSFWLDEASQAQMSSLPVQQIWLTARRISTHLFFTSCPIIGSSWAVLKFGYGFCQ